MLDHDVNLALVAVAEVAELGTVVEPGDLAVQLTAHAERGSVPIAAAGTVSA